MVSALESVAVVSILPTFDEADGCVFMTKDPKKVEVITPVEGHRIMEYVSSRALHFDVNRLKLILRDLGGGAGIYAG